MTQARLIRFLISHLAILLLVLTGSSCVNNSKLVQDKRNKLLVSVKDQRLLLVCDGVPLKSYRVSTSKFGLGDHPGSNKTPLGHMKIAKKIGCRAEPGAVFKSRRPTGEVLPPNAPGRDPIVTRILWLKGMERQNSNAFRRMIYIHGTPEERRLGNPVSYGCIRMSSRDVIDLYNRVGYGADVFIVPGSIQMGFAQSLAVAGRNLGYAFGSDS